MRTNAVQFDSWPSSFGRLDRKKFNLEIFLHMIDVLLLSRSLHGDDLIVFIFEIYPKLTGKKSQNLTGKKILTGKNKFDREKYSFPVK